MAFKDLNDPEVRAEAIASGVIWSLQPGAIEAAIEDINSGRVPPPDYVPDQYKADITVELPEPQVGGPA
jgi:hypothetical protein